MALALRSRRDEWIIICPVASIVPTQQASDLAMLSRLTVSTASKKFGGRGENLPAAVDAAYAGIAAEEVRPTASAYLR